jgi:branched-chain amino acid transport system substrate-binding protein
VSGSGIGARIRSLLGLDSGGRAEAIRLTVAVALAAGIVFLGESLASGGHSSHGSAKHSVQNSQAGKDGGVGGAGAASGQQSSKGGVTVAGGPAVERSLRSGSMVVVVDQPPPGLFSEQNRSIAQGAEVAVDELNAKGGLLARHIHVKLVRQSLDGLSATAVQARLRSEAAAVLILPCDTNSQLSLAGGASNYGMLMLAPCNPDATAGRRYPTYWPVGMAATDEAAGLASLGDRVGYRRVFVVSAQGTNYVELLTNAFRSAAQTEGIQVVGSASIDPASTDFSGLANAIKAANPSPTAIFTALPPPLVNRVAAGLLAQGVGQAVLGSAAMDTPLTLASDPKAKGPKALENAIFASYGFPRVSASARRFLTDYHTTFGHEPVGSFPGLGFETIRLLEAAVHKVGSAEPSAIQQALAGGVALQGVALATRTYERGGDHNPVGTVAITKIAGGSFFPLVAITPSNAPTP